MLLSISFAFWCPQLEGQMRGREVEEAQLHFGSRFSGYQHNQPVLSDLWLEITE